MTLVRNRHTAQACVIVMDCNDQQRRIFIDGLHGPKSATAEMPEGTTRKSGYSVLWTPLGYECSRVARERADEKKTAEKRRVKWIDCTIYTQGDKVRTPRSWQHPTALCRIVVTRRHDIDPSNQTWFLVASDVAMGIRVLKSQDIEEAHGEAVLLVQDQLDRWRRSLDGEVLDLEVPDPEIVPKRSRKAKART